MVAPPIVRDTHRLTPGSPNHPGVFHSDRDDQIQLCPSPLGQGYAQRIPLREDLTLAILDYTLDRPQRQNASSL